MSKTYSELMQEIEALQAAAAEARRAEVADVIERIKQAIAVYGLTPADLGFNRPGRKPGAAKSAPAPAKRRGGRRPASKSAGAGGEVKYRDGNNVWGGRGPRPKWLREALAGGKSLKDFAV